MRELSSTDEAATRLISRVAPPVPHDYRLPFLQPADATRSRRLRIEQGLLHAEGEFDGSRLAALSLLAANANDEPPALALLSAWAGGDRVTFPAGSIGDALVGQALVPVSGAANGRSLRLVRTVVVPIRDRHRQRLRVGLRLASSGEQEAQSVFLGVEHDPDDGMARALRAPLSSAASSRLEAVLVRACASGPLAQVDLERLTSELLTAATVEAGPDSFAAWVTERLSVFDSKRKGEPLVEVDDGREKVAYFLNGTSIGTEWGELGAGRAELVSVLSGAGGAIADVRAEPIQLGWLEGDSRTATIDLESRTRAEQALEAWRAAAARTRRRQKERAGWNHLGEMPLHEVPLLTMMDLWASEGPPAQRPTRLRFDENVLLVEPFRALSNDEMEAWRREDPHAVVAFRVGAWTIALSPYLNTPESEEAWEGRITIRRDQEPSHVVLMTDPWNEPAAFTIDGDAPLFRDFARWLTAQLRARELDVVLRSFVPENERSDEDDAEWREFRLTAWLGFGERWREEVALQELLDWRLQPDIIQPGRHFACSPVASNATHAQLEERVEAWHRLIRECIDPAFEPVV